MKQVGKKAEKKSSNPLLQKSKRVIRSQNWGKGRVPLHQQFLNIIETAQSEVKTEKPKRKNHSDYPNTEARHDSLKKFKMEETEEQTVPSPVPANLSAKDKTILCQLECKSNGSFIPSPKSMEMIGKHPQSSSNFLDSISYFNQVADGELPSTFMDESSLHSNLDIDQLMNEILNVKTSQHDCTQETDDHIEVCHSSQEIAQLSEGLVHDSLNSLNSDNHHSFSLISETKPREKAHSAEASCSSDICGISQCVQDLREDNSVEIIEGIDAAHQKNPFDKLLHKEKLSTYSYVSRIANIEIEKIQNVQTEPKTSEEEVVKKIHGLDDSVVLDIKASGDKVDVSGTKNTTEDFYADLSLSCSQFLEIDAICQQDDTVPNLEEANSSQASTSVPQSDTQSNKADFKVPYAPKITWTQAVANSQRRLQAITQEISRLNALVLRARRTLWPQQANNSKSNQQQPKPSYYKTPHPHLPKQPADDGTPSYPDWNYS